MKCEEEESFTEGRAMLRRLLECGRNEPGPVVLFSFLKLKILLKITRMLRWFGTITSKASQ